MTSWKKLPGPWPKLAEALPSANHKECNGSIHSSHTCNGACPKRDRKCKPPLINHITSLETAAMDGKESGTNITFHKTVPRLN